MYNDLVPFGMDPVPGAMLFLACVVVFFAAATPRFVFGRMNHEGGISLQTPPFQWKALSLVLLALMATTVFAAEGKTWRDYPNLTPLTFFSVITIPIFVLSFPARSSRVAFSRWVFPAIWCGTAAGWASLRALGPTGEVVNPQFLLLVIGLGGLALLFGLPSLVGLLSFTDEDDELQDLYEKCLQRTLTPEEEKRYNELLKTHPPGI